MKIHYWNFTAHAYVLSLNMAARSVTVAFRNSYQTILNVCKEEL